MVEPTFLDEAPSSDQVTEYDERHLVSYLQLLDADNEGADWQEAVKIIFGLDPKSANAAQVHASHLARARWMARDGYRQLAQRGHEFPRTG
ncbi:MAG: DUF2285 domain-containing protein [Cupriavidus sp.]|nr:MAG: DUF2285 domain-containing protein [Cupriavidus sp.]